MALTITVTKECIQAGKRCDKQRCPISLAMRDVGCRWPKVGSRGIEWQIAAPPYFKRAFLPKIAMDFVEAFDANKKVEPIVFEVEVV